MRSIVLATLTLFLLVTASCTVGPEDSLDPDEDIEAIDDEASDDDKGTASVAPGCFANTNCTGPKTCGAWTSYGTCGAPFQRCQQGCGFITRWGCSAQATMTPQNRSRTCTMNATGATCVEYDYREVLTSCPV